MRILSILLVTFSLFIASEAICAKKRKKRRRVKKRKTTTTEEPVSQSAGKDGKVSKKPPLAIGVNIGWESLYGNSLSMHYRFIDMLGVNFGAGFNTTGAKLGFGGELFFELSKPLTWSSTLAFVYSSGTNGQVSIDASFTPIDTGVPEDLVATKNYELSSGSLLNLNSGILWDYSSSIQFITNITYNVVLSGNEIKLSEETSYDKAVEITNQSEFYAELKDKAKEQVEPGGLGFFVGLRFYL